MYLNRVIISLLSQSPTLSGNSPGDIVSVTFSTVFSLKLTMQPLLQTSYPGRFSDHNDAAWCTHTNMLEHGAQGIIILQRRIPRP
jgi:hypothetical protein